MVRLAGGVCCGMLALSLVPAAAAIVIRRRLTERGLACEKDDIRCAMQCSGDQIGCKVGRSSPAGPRCVCAIEIDDAHPVVPPPPPPPPSPPEPAPPPSPDAVCKMDHELLDKLCCNGGRQGPAGMRCHLVECPPECAKEFIPVMANPECKKQVSWSRNDSSSRKNLSSQLVACADRVDCLAF